LPGLGKGPGGRGRGRGSGSGRLCVTKIFESMRSLSHLREWCLIILPFQQYVLLACGIVWAKAQRRMQQQSGTASHEPFPDE
jgi:hypothetical protein